MLYERDEQAMFYEGDTLAMFYEEIIRLYSIREISMLQWVPDKLAPLNIVV